MHLLGGVSHGSYLVISGFKTNLHTEFNKELYLILVKCTETYSHSST